MGDEIEKSFDSFLENEFAAFNKPVFNSVEEKKTAMLIWWRVECKRRYQAKQIYDFSLAFYNLTGISKS